jgi:hypothetical protein
LGFGVKGLGGVFSIRPRTASRELSEGFVMGVSYGATKAKLKPTKLPKTVLTAMGTIVRAFAEIDDMVNLHICNMGEVKEGMATILLGRTPISGKLKIAAYLARLRGIQKFHDSLFDAEFRELLKVRNIVAHGVLLGKTIPGNCYAFLTDGQLEPADLKLTRETMSIGARDFKAYAVQAAETAVAIEKALKLGAWRETRFQQFLRPHRKSQPKVHKGNKRKRPPQSFRA